MHSRNRAVKISSTEGFNPDSYNTQTYGSVLVPGEKNGSVLVQGEKILKSYVGDSNSYVGDNKSYVGDNNPTQELVTPT